VYESKLSPLKSVIDQWLLDDLDAPKKQRHSAKRVFERLQDEYPDELNVGKRTVERYVKVIKSELRKDKVECALALEHHNVDDQVDFGEVYHRLPGDKLEKGYELVVSFPYSNVAFSYYCLGQNQECLLEGLQCIFEATDGVPKRLLFDNLSAAVVKIEKDGQRSLTDQFSHFRAHYGFIAAFCNPAKGNEKGHVENKVGYTRRNFFVPVSQIQDYQTFNADLIMLCFKDMNRPHHNKEVMISKLFEEYKMGLLDLAKTSFKVFRRKVCKTDKYELNPIW